MDQDFLKLRQPNWQKWDWTNENYDDVDGGHDDGYGGGDDDGDDKQIERSVSHLLFSL